MSQTTIDELPVAQLPDRYSISRSVLYVRLTSLKIEPEKRGNKAYVNAAQIELLDRLHSHIQSGGSTADFLVSAGLSDERANRQTDRQTEQTGRLALQDSEQPLWLIINTLVTELINHRTSDLLANFRSLEEAAISKWLLSSSQVRLLLERNSLPKDSFDQYGFTFTPAGRNGAEKAWRITKVEG